MKPVRTMPPLRVLRRARQRGVAVITALLLTTLAVAIVASLFWQQQVQVRSMENQRLHLQTKWILRGALDWATLVLDTFNNAPYTSLDQAWATPLAETRLDQYIERERIAGENFDATLSGNVTDACSRYNLTNLANNKQPEEEQVALFGRLLRNLQLQETLASRVADVVAASQTVQAPVENADPSQNPTPNPQPTRTRANTVTGSPMKLLQVDDLLAVPGFTPEIVERLRPFVIVLPQKSEINVNTAAPEVLAALVPNMSVSEANSLAARRKQAPWRALSYFSRDVGESRPLAPGAAGVKSDWFLVSSRIRLDRAALDAEALVQRGSALTGTGTRVVWIRQN